MIKKYIAIFMVVLISLSLYGCNISNSTTDEDVSDKTDEYISDKEDENIVDENENQIVDPNPNTSEEKVTLYFVNKEYIETGDESLEKLIPENRTIVTGNIPLEEAIVKELMKGSELNNLSTAIPSSATLLGVEVADKTAFVNFSQEGLYGGSLQEDLTIAQIVDTLLELDHINKVQFLIDGKKAESLMGHISIIDPFEKPIYVNK